MSIVEEDEELQTVDVETLADKSIVVRFAIDFTLNIPPEIVAEASAEELASNIVTHCEDDLERMKTALITKLALSLIGARS